MAPGVGGLKLSTRVADTLYAGPIPCARGADGPRHMSMPHAPERTASWIPRLPRLAPVLRLPCHTLPRPRWCSHRPG